MESDIAQQDDDAVIGEAMQDTKTPDSGRGEVLVGPNDVKDIKQGILTKTVKSWRDFIDFVADPEQCSGPLIYRGQANTSWEVIATIERLERRFPLKPNLNVDGVPLVFRVPRVSRQLQLNRFKEMARGKLRAPIPDSEEDEWWAIAQHHGLATPMLDWCYSPFVALYFAFEDEKCIDGDTYREPENRGVFALSHHLTGQCHVLACLRGGIVNPFPVPFSSDTVGLTVQSNDLPGYGGDRSSSP
ncbi:MAG TPA: FRG domain-containing protein, partial [Dissulfurispiraceae bacterium]|nr:FRG domain-containing protein [Dissulfurispiraceae bacterium]